MMGGDASLQVVFVDLLFLCLAGGMALWFRAWLREQQVAMDRRVEALEQQQQNLARICERLSSACRSLERATPGPEGLARGGRSPAAATLAAPTTDLRPPVAIPEPEPQRAARAPRGSSPAPPPPPRQRVETPAAQADRQWEELTDRSREAYRRARELLEQGMEPTDIARRVGLGVAEVNVLKRMRDAGRR